MLKTYLLLGCILVCFSVQADEFKIINSEGFQGLANSKGEVLVPAVYEQLGWSDGQASVVSESIGYRENGRWGLINVRTKKLTSAKYVILEPFNESLFEAGIEGKFTNIIYRGLIDNQSKVHLNFDYYTISLLNARLWVVSKYESKRLNFGVYSDENMPIVPVLYRSISSLGNFIEVENHQRKHQLFDPSGKAVLARWIDAVAFLGDGIMLQDQGYFGEIDHSGREIWPIELKSIANGVPVYFPQWEIKLEDEKTGFKFRCDSIVYEKSSDLLIAHVNNVTHILAVNQSLFQDQQHTLKYLGKGFLVTQNNNFGTWGIYKTDGREIATGFDSVYVDDNFFYGLGRDGWDVYNLFGRKLNERPLDKVGQSHAGFIPYAKNGYWGWLDFQGNKTILNRYDNVLPTKESDHFLANNYGMWGVMSFADEWVIMPRYDTLFIYQDFYIGRKNIAHFVLDQKGNLLHQLPYEIEIDDFLLIKDYQQKGLLTTLGAYIYPEFSEVKRVGDYYVLKRDEHIKLIDASGRSIIEYSAGVQDVLSQAHGYFHIIKDDRHGFMNMDAKLRIANRYDSAVFFNEGLAPIKLMGKWGFVDENETLVIQPYYEYSSTFEQGLAIIATTEGYGLIDKKGHEVVASNWVAISRLSTGNYLLLDGDNKYGLANASGKILLGPNYDRLVDTDKGLIIATRYGKVGVLDYSGKTQLPFKYDDVHISGDYYLLKLSDQ